MGKINSVILADDSAEDLGEFFVDMKNAADVEICNYRRNNQVGGKTILLNSNCDKINFSASVALINELPFLFLVFAHGKNDAILVGGENVISPTDNYYSLSNALIYTFSCYNGNKLADRLLANKVKLYVGYKGKVNCPYGLEEYTGRVVLSFISAFLGGKNAKDSFDCLYDDYTKLLRDNSLDPFQKSFYQENRDNLVLKGNMNLALKDFLSV